MELKFLPLEQIISICIAVDTQYIVIMVQNPDRYSLYFNIQKKSKF